MVATSLLEDRPSRAAVSAVDAAQTLDLVDLLAREPRELFAFLAGAITTWTQGGSGGVSLLDEENNGFFWPAVTGGLSAYIGKGTPADFGPCGTVLERGEPLLFLHPERFFTYLDEISPPLEEVLLVPFHVGGRAVGTVWSVIHEQGVHFDREDRRQLETLSDIAASAYEALSKTGAIDSIFKVNNWLRAC